MITFENNKYSLTVSTCYCNRLQATCYSHVMYCNITIGCHFPFAQIMLDHYFV